jgi:Tol biopolymer transport system component
MKHLPYCVSILLISLAACSADKETGPPPSDTTPPASVRDLSAVTAVVGDSIILAWTAPGDDGTVGQASRYEIRYSESPMLPGDWATATLLPNCPAPGPAGQPEHFVVRRLESHTWYFALKTADEVPNWSGISNTAVAVEPDRVPPATVTNLAVSSASETSLTLTWTAPGDDGAVGKAAEYDLRYALSEITTESWGHVNRVEGLSPPDSAGSVQTFTLSGLESSTTYYFGLRTADETPTWSGLATASGTTLSPGTGTTRLTFSSRFWGAHKSDWSPDGQSIAFLADWAVQYKSQLYVIPTSGGRAVKLTNFADGVIDLAWSPDGRQIAVVALQEYYPNTYSDLFLLDSDPGSTPALLVSHASRNIYSPTWSPKGDRIAYELVDPAAPETGSELRIISSSGGESELLFHTEGGLFRPEWSPDGARIAFSWDQNGDFDIWVIAVSGGDPVQMTDDPGSDIMSAWSPDGTQIAFSSDRSGSYDIWVMSSNGENQRQLTSDPGIEADASWSPDARAISYSSQAGIQGISDIWILHLE